MSDSIGFLRKDATFVPEVRSPTVRRRELGALLRALRLRNGLTIESAAEQLMFSMSKLSRMETGHGVPTARDLRDLWDLYGVTDGAERDQMTKLAAEGKQQGWWQSYDLDFATYVGLEAEAVGIRDYQSAIMPGLLQTPSYARAMAVAAVPTVSPERVEALIEVRQMRQRLLVQEPAVRLEVVLDEAVFHRAVGGAAVMRAQLERLVEVSRLPNVTIQIIPYNAGAHPAMESTFNILDFVGSVPRVVYVEGLVGWIYIERPQDVSKYQQVFERLQSMGLNPKESIGLIKHICTKL